MALRRTLSALLVGTLVACGGTYAGLGENLDETGGPLGDDSGGIDAVFPIDDGAAPDTMVDSTIVDSGAPDAADSTLVDAVDANDTASDAADTALVDTADSTVVDAADTAVADTAVADTAIADTAVADTAVADTAVVDTAVADTAVADTAVADSGTPDTGTPDTGTPDTGVVDTGSDAGLFSTNPNQVYCGNTAGLLCAKNQLCCGSYSFGSGSWSYSCTTSCSSFGLRSFECNEKADCSSGQVCCANRAPFGSSNLADSSCHSSCGGIGNPPVQLCMTAADCPTGHACVPGTTDGAGNQTIGQCN